MDCFNEILTIAHIFQMGDGFEGLALIQGQIYNAVRSQTIVLDEWTVCICQEPYPKVEQRHRMSSEKPAEIGRELYFCQEDPG